MMKDKLIKMCYNNIKFAKQSLLITLYCGASSVSWSEDRIKKRIIRTNTELLNKLVVGIRDEPCSFCNKPTTRYGRQTGTRRMLFCSTECEDKYLESDLCSIEGCAMIKHCKGMCKYHYAKAYSLEKNNK